MSMVKQEQIEAIKAFVREKLGGDVQAVGLRDNGDAVSVRVLVGGQVVARISNERRYSSYPDRWTVYGSLFPKVGNKTYGDTRFIWRKSLINALEASVPYMNPKPQSDIDYEARSAKTREASVKISNDVRRELSDKIGYSGDSHDGHMLAMALMAREEDLDAEAAQHIEKVLSNTLVWVEAKAAESAMDEMWRDFDAAMLRIEREAEKQQEPAA